MHETQPWTEYPLTDETPPTPSKPSRTLENALTAGSWIHQHLAQASQDHLDTPTKQRFDQHLANAAAGCTYAGLTLWSLNAFTFKHETTRRLAETLAGLGAGILAETPESR